MKLSRTLFAPLAGLVLLVAACGNDDDTQGEPVDDLDVLVLDTAGSEPPEVVDTEPAVLRPGLQVTSVDFTTGVAVITNLGDRDVDLTGHWICNRPNYAELPAQTLAPGDQVEASLGGFSPDGGEVAIYTSDAFGDPDALMTYVGWGSGGGRQPVAEEAGLWTGAPVQPAGDVIELSGAPGSATGWS